VAPMFASASFARKFLYEAIVPQMTSWIGWTVVVGSIFGVIAAAFVWKGKQAASAA